MKTAVVLYSLGGPWSLDQVKPFLREMFEDPEIIGLPQPFRSLLAWTIATLRENKAKDIYRLMGGGSPLLTQTQNQAEALERELGSSFKCFVVMRYATPRAETVVKEIEDYDPDFIVHLPLYPQFSKVTSGSSLDEFELFWKKTKNRARRIEISSFQTEGYFIDTIVEQALPLFKEAKAFGKSVLIFSAHGLPEKTALKDPYQRQCEETYRALCEKTKNWDCDKILAYQSKVGPLKWIGPATVDEIEKAAKDGKPVVVIPTAFVSEHSETLVELGMEYKEVADKAGAPYYAVVPTVQTAERFIEGLAGRIRKEMERGI
jgi:ferrochelatase